MALLVVALPSAEAAEGRLTSAANVRLRAQPSVDSSIVTEMPLGTALTELDGAQDGSWILVRAANGQEGWVSAALTRDVPAGQRLQVVENIVQARLAREGDGFPAQVELLDFVEREMSAVSDAETAARFALYRLRAVQDAALAIPFLHGHRREPFVEWVTARQALVGYNEPEGCGFCAATRSSPSTIDIAATAEAE